MNLSDEDVEVLDKLYRSLDAASFAARIPMSDALHKEALVECVRSTRDTLRGVLTRNGWDEFGYRD